MAEAGTVDFSRLAISFQAASATPRRRSIISVTLSPPQPAGTTDTSGSPGPSTDAAPRNVTLLSKHLVPAYESVSLELVLSGAVGQRYSPAAHSAVMQPWQGGVTRLQNALGAVERAGQWVFTVASYGADSFAGRTTAALAFDWSPDDSDGTVACVCDCDEAVRQFATELAPPSLCRPLSLPADDSGAACELGSGPGQGYSHRAVSCAALPGLQPADLAQCRSDDCALTAAQRNLLQGLEGSSALVASGCLFWRDCGTVHRYEVGEWTACSADCWQTQQSRASQPVQTRSVACVATSVAAAAAGGDVSTGGTAQTGGGVAVKVPVVECEAAGLSEAPPAQRACNLQPCVVGECSYSAWSVCSNTCGAGVRTRTVTCGGDDASCAQCAAPLEETCVSKCGSCAANRGMGPCVYGTCVTWFEGVSCECDADFKGACPHPRG